MACSSYNVYGDCLDKVACNASFFINAHVSLFVLAVAQTAEKDGVPVFKFPRWRNKEKQTLPDVWEKYKSVGAELNVMPFCSQFIPMDVVSHPKHKSIIYHPSILPRHRGASAINWYVPHRKRHNNYDLHDCARHIQVISLGNVK